MNPLLGFAKQMLAKRGSFVPFGASLTSDGEIAMAAAFISMDDSDPVTMIEFIVRGFQEEAGKGKIRATGVCIEMRIVPPNETEMTDVICVKLEHIEGDCLDVYLPYKKGWLGRYKFGRMFAVRGDAQVFATRDLSDG